MIGVRGIARSLTVVLALAAPLRAQDRAPEPPPPASSPAAPESESRIPRPSARDLEAAMALEAKAISAFAERRYADAEGYLREQLKLQPGNYVVLYNLACARTAQGDTKEGMSFLVQAIEGGFDDLVEMRKDPSLRPLQNDPEFRKIVEHWPSLLEARRDANVESVLEFFGKNYRVERDERLRLVYVSDVNPQAVKVAIGEIARLGEWASKAVFPGLLDPDSARNDPWVVVVLPRREDFLRWIISRHGEDAVSGMSSIGGEYDHDTKILVAQDLGSSLRHEFFHVLHWRSCMRLGQRHAFWVQEGLCSLVEDYKIDDGGDIIPQQSWRTNIVKRLEKVGQLRGLADLCAMSQRQFMSSRVLASYARARTAFLFLYDQGKLKDWYAAYTDTFRDDPSGLKAWTQTLGKPMKEIDLAMRGWIHGLEMVPEQILPGMASLGVEVETGGGDGLEVTRVVDPKRSRSLPLKVGDIITDIDGHSTRDMAELVRVLGQYKPGDSVPIGLRRGAKIRTETLTLVAKQ